ncbi:hypothetical protein [Mycobacterium sp. IS-1264]|uniref:hypothetical protein n=1 Tax=Mycobacterium sp. IS-1264 TaxID=1834158 RepID=UPI003204DBE1
MTEESVIDTSKSRYGPISFVAAFANVFVVEVVTWLFVLPMPPLALIVFPASLVYTVLCAVVVKAPGKIGQAGRGMLVGSLAGPLSLIIFIPAFIIAHAVGPI